MSRFAYHTDDEPGAGGVRSVKKNTKEAARSHGSHTPRPASNGAPGPEEPLLDISELVRTIGMHYEHHFALPPSAEPELEAVTPITGEILLNNTGAALLLTGAVSATLRLECGRCLEPVDVLVEAEIEESFDLVAPAEANRKDEIQAVDENVEAAVITANILNLADLLRQNLILASPLRPVCDDVVACQKRMPHVELLVAADEVPEPATNNPLKDLGALWEQRAK